MVGEVKGGTVLQVGPACEWLGQCEIDEYALRRCERRSSTTSPASKEGSMFRGRCWLRLTREHAASRRRPKADCVTETVFLENGQEILPEGVRVAANTRTSDRREDFVGCRYGGRMRFDLGQGGADFGDE